MRLALRSLARTPGFTTIALLTLALGIGVNTSMFSALRTFALRTLPYPEGGRLVHVHRMAENAHTLPHAAANFLDLRTQQTAFAQVAALQGGGTFNLAPPGEPAERLRGYRVSHDFFPLLGVAPAFGRVFTADEDQPGNDRVAVLSHRFWNARFGGDRAIVGRDIRLDGENVTVVGVMPPAFEDPLLWGQADVWRPLALSAGQATNRRSNYLRVIARLKPGVGPEQAEAGLKTLWAQLVTVHPENARTDLRLAPLNRGSRIDDGAISWFILVLAGLVLLIACANLANLQFARTAARAREHAIRAALGATRGRLMRDVLGESLLLALVGGALGVLVAVWCNDLLGRHVFVPPATRGIDISLDVGVLVFAVVAASLAGVGFGLLPAWLVARAPVNVSLKQGGPAHTASRVQHRVRHALIVAEVTLALVLLATASLFARGLQRAMHTDPGWRIEGLLTANFTIQSPPTSDTPEKRTAHRLAFVDQLEEQLAALPGVERVAFATALPTYGLNATSSFLVEGRPEPAPGSIPAAGFALVTPDYFAALGLPVVAGRTFTTHDRAGTPAVAIINERMARTFFPGESPLGKRIRHPDSQEWREIVGVVRDARPAVTLDLSEVGYQMYLAYAQNPGPSLELALRAQSAAETLAPAVRRIVAALHPEQPIEEVSPLREELGFATQNITLAGWMLGAFAVLGVLLAALGLYAVIANTVVGRTREIGLRLALGAQVRDVLTLVLGQGFRLALIGTALGLAGALAVARVLRTVAPALGQVDVPALTGVVALILVVTALACWLPARRATKVDPLVALRAE